MTKALTLDDARQAFGLAVLATTHGDGLEARMVVDAAVDLARAIARQEIAALSEGNAPSLEPTLASALKREADQLSQRALHASHRGKRLSMDDAIATARAMDAISDGDRTHAEDAQVVGATERWHRVHRHGQDLCVSGASFPTKEEAIAADHRCLGAVEVSWFRLPPYDEALRSRDATIADLRAQLDEKDRELAALKHDIERHIAIAAEHATEAGRSALSQSKEG